MMPAQKEAAPLQSVVDITYLDGTKADYPISHVMVYRASKEGASSPIELTYTAAWLAAGRPKGDIEEWLETIATFEERDAKIPPTNGKAR